MATPKEKEYEEKERFKTRREKIGGYFLNMSQLAFAGMVVGGIMPIFSSHSLWDYITIALGVTFTVTFAMIGNKILK